MVCRKIEITDDLYEYFDRMACERGRSVEAEVEIFFSLLIRDPDYLDHMERKIAGEEWEDSDNEDVL